MVVMTKITTLLVYTIILASCCGVKSQWEDPTLLPLPEVTEFSDGYYSCEGVDDYTKIVSTDIQESLEKTLGQEGYILDVDKKGIRIQSATPTGAFYALQSVKQLTDEKGVRFAHIKDSPRFPYRGFHLDVSRNYFPKEEIMKLLDEMAYYKMNNFHFHLTDNGGWRIQIDKYPLLTKLGSSRKILDWFDWYLQDRHFCPEDTPNAFGGYYTKQDIKDIVSYASERFINVIPEIDIPAHSDPVFAGYPYLNCTNTISGNGEYCPALEATYTFIENVLDEVMELFPSKIIHIGGDEARKVEWKKCSRCKALMDREGLTDYDDLQVYLIRRIHKYLTDHGRVMAGWDELMKDDNLSDAIIYSYRGQKHGIDAANKRLKTIMVPGEALYLDWWQADIDKEPVAMGGYSPLHKFYKFNALPLSKEDVYENELLIQSRAIENVDSVGFIQKANMNYMIGVQGCLWTEFVETPEHLEYMTFPRLLAIAEKGWSKTSDGWDGFTKRIKVQVKDLHSRGINAYDLHDAPQITAKASEEGQSIVSMLTERYGGEIRYCSVGEQLNKDSKLYTGPFPIGDDCTIVAGVFENGELVSYTRQVSLKAGQNKLMNYPQRWPW